MFHVQLYFSSFYRLYILLISICPMLKAGKMKSIAILANLFKSFFRGAKIWWLFVQLYKISLTGLCWSSQQSAL